MKKKKVSYELLSGCWAFGLILCCFLISGLISISGNKCILVSDMYGQYYQFLMGIRRILLEGKSLVFSWNLDMGIGLAGWIAYYVVSPFNLLLLLVPEAHLVAGITVVILLKIVSCAVTFTYACRRIFACEDISVVFMSLCYSLSSYLITYYFQIMWLDAVILLPLLVYFLKRMIDTGRWGAFTVCLAVSFITSYYMAYMTGIFLFTCFVFYYIYQKGTIFTVSFVKKLGLLIRSAIIAFGMCAFLLIPTVLQMLERLGEGKVDREAGILNFTLVELFRSMLIGNYVQLDSADPLIYVSCFAFILVIYYFFSKHISKREKICVGILLATWIVIMVCPYTDLYMHMGNNPTCFPYRYAFAIDFLMCMIGLRVLLILKEHMEVKKIVIICGTLILFSLVLFLFTLIDRTSDRNKIGIAISILFFLGYMMVAIFEKKGRIPKQQISQLLFVCLVIELVVNSAVTYYNMDQNLYFRNHNIIAAKEEILRKQLAELPDGIKDYRIEKNYRIGYNDGFGYGYNSISSFSSIYNMGLHRFFENVGIVNELWRAEYAGSTSFLDSILGIKYILHAPQYSFFTMSTERMDFIEENPFPLSLGFLVDSSLENWQLSSKEDASPIEAQKEILQMMTGNRESGECFQLYQPDRVKYDNVIRTNQNGKIVMKRKNPSKEGKVTYYFTRNDDKEYYFYPKVCKDDKTNYVEVTSECNDGSRSPFVERMSLSHPYNIRIFADPQKTEDSITFTFLRDETLVLDEELFYSFDKEMFKQYYDCFAQHGVQITEWKEGMLKGNVEVTDDHDLLFLSIPYNDQWEVKVDGRKAEILPVGSESFIGLKLQKGTHVITMDYKQRFASESPGISVICTIGVFCMLLLNHRKKNSIKK